MTFLTDQFIYIGLMVVGFFLGLIAASYIFNHYHHCTNKCAFEGCMRDGTQRVWSDRYHHVIYICDKDAGTSTLKQGLKKATEYASGYHN